MRRGPHPKQYEFDEMLLQKNFKKWDYSGDRDGSDDDEDDGWSQDSRGGQHASYGGASGSQGYA